MPGPNSDSNPIDLLELSDLKQWLDLTTTQSDGLLQSLITSVSRRILIKISRDAILSASYTERYDGSGTPMLALLHYPIIAVASLTINNAPVIPSPDGVQTGFVFDKYTLKVIGSSAWALQPGFYGAPSTFITGFQNVAVTYTAGYAAVPEDLAQAAMEWCAFVYRSRGWIGQQSKRLTTGESVTFTGAMPERILDAIKPYKRRIPV